MTDLSLDRLRELLDKADAFGVARRKHIDGEGTFAERDAAETAFVATLIQFDAEPLLQRVADADQRAVRAEAQAEANRLGKITSFDVPGDGSHLMDLADNMLNWRERVADAERKNGTVSESDELTERLNMLAGFALSDERFKDARTAYDAAATLAALRSKYADLETERDESRKAFVAASQQAFAIHGDTLCELAESDRHTAKVKLDAANIRLAQYADLERAAPADVPANVEGILNGLPPFHAALNFRGGEDDPFWAVFDAEESILAQVDGGEEMAEFFADALNKLAALRALGGEPPK